MFIIENSRPLNKMILDSVSYPITSIRKLAKDVRTQLLLNIDFETKLFTSSLSLKNQRTALYFYKLLKYSLS